MKRLLIIILMTLLPLQITWAVADDYCDAGSGNVSWDAGVAASATGTDLQTNRKGTLACGCVMNCHLFCHISAIAPSIIIPGMLRKQTGGAPLSLSKIYFQSFIPDGPTRPKWPAAS